MKKTFVCSALILIIGGFITKVLGMIIKVSTTRIIGTEGISLYMLIIPTFNLLISLSQFGMPVALAKLISEENKSTKKLFFTNLPIIILINLCLIILVFSTAPFISNNLLHNSSSEICLKSIAFVIPFTTISSICRSYFFGRQKMIPHVISNITESLFRLLIIIVLLPKLLIYSVKYQVLFLILLNIISEILSTIILIFFLPKNIIITKNDLLPNKQYLKDSLSISIPNTLSRLIVSIAYFFEPIILISSLKKNYSLNYITTQYGILNGYVLPLILLPSFFTIAISQALLPVISNAYSNNNLKIVKRKLYEAITLSLIIGIPTTIVIMLKPSLLLFLLYHTTEGIIYLKLLAPIFLLQYLQAPLITILDAIGKSKYNLTANIISTIIRISSLIVLSTLKIGIYSLLMSIIINILITTIYLIFKVKRQLK